ncbi:ABC transporter permease [Flavobacteriaceae bacterium F89]|uniref:ABC transporter permease n=1 Tax=Cerina litoralis TaxID=2874477 RepID=A0AAE3ETA8_9FLAO|nr:ABC transporter permease [Cerina litoralis]MCG2460090.1 ABC transporter permease [Cerina litoralis]
MLKNYFKIAFRSLWKNKGYSAINIFGLAIGLAACLLITLYVLDELSYDRYNANADRIYRINSDLQFGGGKLHMTQTSDMMGPILKKDYPQVEEFTRIYSNEGSKLIKKGDQFVNEPRIAYVDSTFFKVFTLPSIHGNTNKALDEPNTVVLTETTANKYFGTSDAMGKTIEIKNGESTTPFKVTAVIKDIPHNSHFNFDFMLSMKNANYQWGQLTSHNFNTYLLLKNGTNYKAFERNFDQYKTKYVLPYAQQFIKVKSMEEFEKSGNRLDYSLMPLTKIHLYSDYSFELSPSGNIQYVYIFSAVALFILLLACINFMNLSTAHSARRAKEVGIRKVLGTERRTLILQFLVESTLTACIALFIALTLAYLVMPLFNAEAAKSLTMADLLNIKLLPLLLLLPFVVGLLAGSYPAFFLSRFRPVVVLKGSSNSGFRKSRLRNVLVVFQFATSVILITATIIVYNQLHYIQTAKLGFSKDQVLIINDTYALNSKVKAFKNEVLALNGVSSGTVSSFLPVSSSSRSDNTYSKDAVMNVDNAIDMQTWGVDYDYLKTMGMEIVKGRNFSREFGTDSTAILITETTAKLLGYDDPINKMLYVPSDENGDNSMISLKIIGVVKDFHFESLRQDIGPLCMRLGNSTGTVSFKITSANTSGLINQIENKWKAMAPELPFSYRFLDDSFNDMYQNEQRVGSLAITFAVLAILIACLGLFGLVTYMAEQRTKEIGIRKVLGASISNVVAMISKDFLVLVAISCVIAFPVAWYAMDKWLADYAYRIDIEWWMFLVAGFTALVIALITISFQAIKAAIANPVDSLRTE